MERRLIIDGNNLLHAMHAHAPLPSVGRETLVRILERWARKGDESVTLVFDGPEPAGGMAQQMASRVLRVRFSGPATADDVIVRLIHQAKDPGSMRVVSDDTAIRKEARERRCRHTGSVAFVKELFSTPDEGGPSGGKRTEKPQIRSSEERDEWLEFFGLTDDEDLPDSEYDMPP